MSDVIGGVMEQEVERLEREVARLTSERGLIDAEWKRDMADLRGQLERQRHEAATALDDAARLTRDLAAERAMRRSYESGITWETSCLGCARLLTDLRATEDRAEKAEAELRAMRPAATLHWIRSGHGATSTCARCGEARTAWCVGCGYCETTCCACHEPFAAEAPHG